MYLRREGWGLKGWEQINRFSVISQSGIEAKVLTTLIPSSLSSSSSSLTSVSVYSSPLRLSVIAVWFCLFRLLSSNAYVCVAVHLKLCSPLVLVRG